MGWRANLETPASTLQAVELELDFADTASSFVRDAALARAGILATVAVAENLGRIADALELSLDGERAFTTKPYEHRGRF